MHWGSYWLPFNYFYLDCLDYHHNQNYFKDILTYNY